MALSWEDLVYEVPEMKGNVIKSELSHTHTHTHAHKKIFFLTELFCMQARYRKEEKTAQ